MNEQTCPYYKGIGGDPLEITPELCAGGKELSECFQCGWHPAVNQIRRQQLRYMQIKGRLKEWGK